MPHHRAISVAEIGFSAVLAEGLVRAFIGATDGGLSLRRIETGRQIGARIIHPLRTRAKRKTPARPIWTSPTRAGILYCGVKRTSP